MTDDELELKILQRFVDQFRKAATGLDPDDKRARELDMREVLHELTGKTGAELDYETESWHKRLVERPHGGHPNAPLRPGASGQKYGARAFRAGAVAPAWDRIRDLQRLLGVNAAHSPSHVTINIQNSTVAGLNLGTVIGNIEAAVSTLQQTDPEIATALARLVEAVGRDESLGDQRREVIESLNQVAEEATKPFATRRTGLVKTLLAGIQVALAQSAHISEVWQTFGPTIKGYFGLS
ncbi:MAG: hypothetical protein ACRDFW_02305 [bacterium]